MSGAAAMRLAVPAERNADAGASVTGILLDMNVHMPGLQRKLDC